MPRSSSASSFYRAPLKASALVLALAAATSAMAAENGNQRYSAGIGGSDMTTPVVPGLYFQAPMVAYHASKIKGNDGKQLTQNLAGFGLPTVNAAVGIDADTYAILPRLTYISSHRLLGAHVAPALTEGIEAAEASTGARCMLIADIDRAYGAAAGSELVERLGELQARLNAVVPVPPVAPTESHPVERHFAKEDFEAAVLRCKEYIAAGDCMQVVIGQRLQKRFTASPLTLYRALRSLNPSPYMYYYDMGDHHVVGSSPEILVRQEKNADGGETVTIRPIAGTRPRGATPEADLAHEQELLADPKERAEHVMLIDLARNDIGRIAKTGSVKVTEAFGIERYSHVMHIVSNVEGTLKDGMSALDVLRASFPAGTLSGAPKIRAMEIIDELEPVQRGVYGGAVGYLSFAGDMDVAIAIRTGVIKDQTLYVQAGAGVVADSVPELEWKETEAKARAVVRAAELVEQGL